jgi:hypothetical protein
MVRFDAAHRAFHYPPDRRFRIWIRPSILIGTGIAIVSMIVAAWIASWATPLAGFEVTPFGRFSTDPRGLRPF